MKAASGKADWREQGMEFLNLSGRRCGSPSDSPTAFVARSTAGSRSCRRRSAERPRSAGDRELRRSVSDSGRQG